MGFGMMKLSMMCSLGSLVVCAGSAMGVAQETPATLEPSLGPVREIAHIYYNVASGERVVTLLGDSQTTGTDAGGCSRPIWSTQVSNPCADAGFTQEYFFGVDNPGELVIEGRPSLSTQLTVMDYGDIETDTVVDCIQVNWVVAHQDTDTNSDGIGDGVEELAGQWIVWDADNGRAVNQCMRLPLMDLLIQNLPGDIEDGMLSAYTMDIDLRAFDPGLDMTFEIGDSDGDCQTAAFCNSSVFDSATSTFLPIAQCDNDFDSMLDSDLDGDGLFDWSWTVRFYQPGIGNDFDSDMDTGSAAPTSADTIGISFGFPEGSAIDNGDETWTWDIDTSVYDAATGEEDRFAIYNPPIDDGNGGEIITYNGGYWFGGFSCEPDPDFDSGYTPPAMFKFRLYGPRRGDPCPDLNGDGVFNFFDVSLFIQDFTAGGDYNGDGMTDFFDVSTFIADFSAGCP